MTTDEARKELDPPMPDSHAMILMDAAYEQHFRSPAPSEDDLWEMARERREAESDRYD